MSNQFLKLRRSAVPGRVPSTSSIDFGEIALNTYDGLAFIKRSGSMGEEVITLGSREGAFTGSFSGSFVGNGGGLFNIPASGIVGLNLSQIGTGSVTASVSTGVGSFSLVSGSSTFLYVSSSGNVGIGTASPAYSLDVAGNIRANAVAFGTTQSPVISGVNGSLYHDINSTTYNYIWRRSSELMRLTGTGNLLLNTTSDDTVNKLQVSGSARITNGLVVTGSATITQNVSIAGAASIAGALAQHNNYGYPGSFRVAGAGIGLYMYYEGYTAASYRMPYIRSDKAIGFWNNETTTPFQFLHEDNASTAVLTIFTGTSANRNIIINNTSSTAPVASSLLTINSTTKGVLLPRMTEAQRLAISSPAQGLLVYDIGSTTEGLWYYNSGSNPGWQGVLTNSGSQTISGSITANNITVTGTLTAQTIVAQTITSSTDYVSGSTIFGNSLSNTHQFTGSVSITGSLSVNGGSVPLGSGAAGQVAYWTGSSAVTGSNSFLWDNATTQLTLGTTTVNPIINLAASANASTTNVVINNAAFGGTLLTFRNPLDNRYVRISGINFDIVNTGNISAGQSLIAGSINISGTTVAGFNNSSLNLNGDTVTLSSRDNNAATIILLAGNGEISFRQRPASVTTTRAIFAQSTGNFIIQNGGTFTDTGERLQVSGSSRFAGNMVISGSGNTSATNGLTVVNSSNLNTFRVRNDGTILIGNDSLNVWMFPYTTYDTLDIAGKNLAIYPQQGSISIGGGSQIQTSGNQSNLITRGRFQPTSGTATFTDIRSEALINQTGGANGTTRGLYINPTLTAAADFRTIEWSTNAATSPSQSWGLYGAGTAPNFLSGSLLIGSASNSGEKLQVDGTMKVTGDLNARARLHVESGIWFNYGGGAFNRKVMSNDNSKVTFRLPTDASSYDFLSWSTNTSLVTIGDFATKLNVIGNAFISGTLDILDAEINYQRNNNVTTGSARLIASIPTASLNAAFFDYVIVSGSNARAGTVTSVWVSSSVEWNETYTNDIGSTSDVTLYSAITGSSIGLFATSSINNVWTIKSLIRTI
jgi:hypothetical protein